MKSPARALQEITTEDIHHAYKQHINERDPKRAAARSERLASDYPVYAWCKSRLEQIENCSTDDTFTTSNIRGAMVGIELLTAIATSSRIPQETRCSLKNFLETVSPDEFSEALSDSFSMTSLPEKGPYPLFGNTLLGYMKGGRCYGEAAKTLEKASGTMLVFYALITVAESKEPVSLPPPQPELFDSPQHQHAII